MSVELLAPGGDPQAVKAAILAGADAVFLGVGDFNARKRAVNITLKDLAELCAIAHDNACRIYLTFNTLAIEPELPILVQLLHDTIAAGIDAVILQDYGLLYLVHSLFPDLEIHASTQMTTHNSGQIRFLKPYGVKQVNFSRELSLSEIQQLTAVCHDEQIMVEVFVHGAFCVSFSGQCYLSNELYSHTANRGACVQPCRRVYTEEKSGNSVQPMNLKDNSLFTHADELIDAGVDSLKIEGRIKGFEYVYNTVGSWREQIDRVVQKNQQERSDQRLTAVFNRSFSDTLLKGAIHKEAFTTESGDESLEEIGSVWGYFADKKELTVKRGTTLPVNKKITIQNSAGKFICTGTVQKSLGDDRYQFKIEHLLKGKIERGQTILAQPQITDSTLLEKRINALIPTSTELPLNLTISGVVGSELTLTAEGNGKRVTVSSGTVLEAASNRPVDHATVKERLGKLGNTPFYLASCNSANLGHDLFIPVKQLNELRRNAVEQLTPQLPATPSVPAIATSANPAEITLAVAVSDPAQLKDIPADIVAILSIPVVPELMESLVPLFEQNRNLIPWFPPILIGEQYEAAVNFLHRIQPAKVVTENSGIAVEASSLSIPWIAGSHLNATNGFALKLFSDHGAIGSFLETELSPEQTAAVSVPEEMELWGSIVSPTLLMNSRHCLVRNCVDCGKEVMDDWCLPNCGRHATIADREKNRLHFIKQRGHYNSIYAQSLCFDHALLSDKRVSTLLIDLRVQHSELQPESIADVIADVKGAVNKNERSVEKLKRSMNGTREKSGFESLLS